jgi:hypothetical protein
LLALCQAFHAAALACACRRPPADTKMPIDNTTTENEATASAEEMIEARLMWL